MKFRVFRNMFLSIRVVPGTRRPSNVPLGVLPRAYTHTHTHRLLVEILIQNAQNWTRTDWLRLKLLRGSTAKLRGLTCTFFRWTHRKNI